MSTVKVALLPPRTGLRGKALLRKAKAAILAEPARLNMGVWSRGANGDHSPACGTVACIAGWVGILAAERDYELGSRIAFQEFGPVGAEELLNITARQGKRLFYTDNWPAQFREKWYQAYTGTGIAELQKKRAAVVAEVIDDFIQREMSDD